MKRTGYIAYAEGNREETRYYPETGKLEFWDNQGGAHKISVNVFGECRSVGKEQKVKEKVQSPKAQHFICSSDFMKSVDLFKTSPGWANLHIVYVNGDTEGEQLQILNGAGYVKLQTKNSQDKEQKERSAGYSSYNGEHLRYLNERI